MTEEEWRPVVGYEGLYEVSSLGRVRSLDRWVKNRGSTLSLRRGRVLKQTPRRSGHLNVGLTRPGAVMKTMSVHRIVATAFVPNPDNLPEVRHWDDNPANNGMGNLRWGTSSDNRNDSVRNGTHANARKLTCKNGHKFDAGNTYRDGLGSRKCRTCHKLRAQKTRQSKGDWWPVPSGLRRRGEWVDVLEMWSQGYPLERVSEVTGVDIRTLKKYFPDAT